MASKKGRKPRGRKAPTVMQSPKPRMMERALTFLGTAWGKTIAGATVLALFLSILVGLSDSIEKLPTTAKRVRDWWSLDANYSGTWTNDTEGMGVPGSPIGPAYEPPPEQGAVALNIEVRDGELSGEITSRVIAEHLPYSHIFVSGEKRWGRVKLVAWDLIGGKSVSLAALEMKHTEVDGEERLVFRTIKQSWPGMFPESFYVWRGEMPAPTRSGVWEHALEAARASKEAPPKE